jgi:leader peptidase (prepilin peptidase)/N-methyltransferase
VTAAATLTALLWLWFTGWTLALAVVDIRQHRLPNHMVATTFAGCIAVTGALVWLSGDRFTLVRAALASVVAVTVFAVGHVMGGMGMGDVKYAAVTGWMLGTISWSAVWWGHLLAFVFAGSLVLIGMVARRIHRKAAMPFGPFMGAGALIVGAGAVLPALAP